MRSQLAVVTVGHVDHGKSTLIGRLLHDTGNLVAGKLEEMRAVCERRGGPFEWSFVLDALQTERDQAITIDTTRIWMKLHDRDVVLIDAPGHQEFLRNMVTGASDADAALLVVDAAEGVSEQTRRHALLLELIGIRSIVVVVNKMDRVDFDAAVFARIASELSGLLSHIHIAAVAMIPIVARDGDNLSTRSTRMPWYTGETIAETLAILDAKQAGAGTDLRLAVQGVIRRGLERIVVGRLDGGSLRVGEQILFSPGARAAHVKAIEAWPGPPPLEARAGESVAFTLDLPLFIERGDIVSHCTLPPLTANVFRCRLLWLGNRSLEVGSRLRMRVGTRVVHVEVEAFERVVDIASLVPRAATHAEKNDVVEVVFRSRESLALDTVEKHAGLARFILLDGVDVVAGGTVLATLSTAVSDDIVPVDHLLDRAARARRNGHRGAVIWLTGLPAAGKSTIAMQLERRLHERGVQSYVLDGDNLRSGLCRDLGFSETDRSENIRRVGEVAALFADAGLVTICAFISPRRDDRDLARKAAANHFHEVFVRADVATCEARDPKGHYARARAGEIADFTGVTGDYEEPLQPNLVLDTQALSLESSVSALLEYVAEVITDSSRSQVATTKAS